MPEPLRAVPKQLLSGFVTAERKLIGQEILDIYRRAEKYALLTAVGKKHKRDLRLEI